MVAEVCSVAQVAQEPSEVSHGQGKVAAQADGSEVFWGEAEEGDEEYDCFF